MPYQAFDLNEYIRQTNNNLRYLHEQIKNLNQAVTELQETTERLQSQKPMEYHYNFDQLKIERLEGTLNIGLCPAQDGSELETFEIGGEQLQMPGTYQPEQVWQTRDESGPDSELGQNVLQGVHIYLNDYFNQQVINDLRGLEEKHQYPLDDAYRQFIINDVKNQLPTRIHYYLKNSIRETKDEQALIQHITKKIHWDIVKAFDVFIGNLPKKKGED
ncbi:spore germination protein GerPC [Camelliibacillus cellulosilyticus]|uniref:Spore germination protein GerPC n=1 Tax=Camelliibacillus cellulosilyticus TaxID=2174486 RepID=A0ABV9GI11_9BACL